MFNRLLRACAGVLGIIALVACAKPAEVRPALWQIEGPQGQKGWLFGTIHALPQPVDWRSDTIEQALAQSDRLILELANIDDDTGVARVFARLAQDSSPPPLARRIDPALADELAAEMARDAIPPGGLDRYETWAAALMIAQAQSRADNQDVANGIDRALAKGYRGPIGELEGAELQLSIFDSLPTAQQAALLGAVIADDPAARSAKVRALEKAWARGDMAVIARLTDREMFADPLLREALLTDRNRAWAEKLAALLNGGVQPFVAVGAGHLAGPDGLPAMLALRGYKVKRLQ